MTNPIMLEMLARETAQRREHEIMARQLIKQAKASRPSYRDRLAGAVKLTSRLSLQVRKQFQSQSIKHLREQPEN